MQKRWLIEIGVVLLIGLIPILGYFYFNGQLALPAIGASRPVASIVAPAAPVSLHSGQGVQLTALGESGAGISRIDLLLNGDVVQTHLANTNQPYFQSDFVWFSSLVGRHTLGVVAFDSNGLASEEAILSINVFPRQAAQVDGETANQDLTIPPAEAISLDESVEDGGVAGGDVAQDGDQPADEGQGAGQPPVDPAADLGDPVAPGDQPPTLRVFEVNLNVDGDQVVASLGAAAEDDLGLDRVEFHLASNNGEVNGFTQFCGDHVSCETGGDVPLSAGEWLLSAQAFDSSGQASEVRVQVVEVIGQPGEPPAAAEHDLEFNDPLVDVQIDFPLGDLGQGFDLQDFLADRFGNRGQEPVENAGSCATISLIANATSIDLTGTVTCNLEADADHFLFVQGSQEILHQGDGGRSLSSPDWFDRERRQIAADESFEMHIANLQCGAEYEIGFRVDMASIVQGGPLDGHVGIGGTEAFVSQVIETLPCANNSIADIDLQVARLGDAAVEATWHVDPDGAWPERITDDGVTFYLMRFQQDTNELEVVDRFDLTKQELLAGRDFSLVDDRLSCGLPYWYSVVVHLAHQENPRAVTPIIQPSVFSEGIPCPGGNLASIDLNISSHWTPGDDEYFLAEAQFPANFAWPQGDQVLLKLQSLRVGSQCQAPCEDGWHQEAGLRITDQVRGQDYAFEERVDPYCGSEQYQLRFVLSVDGQNVAFGPITSVISKPCPPSPPQLISLQGMSAGCPNGVSQCVLVLWERFEEPAREGYASPAAYLILERDNSAGENTRIRLGLNQTQYLDQNPTQQIRANLCSTPTMYRIFAYDANNRTSGASPLSILDFLTCDEPWGFMIERRR